MSEIEIAGHLYRCGPLPTRTQLYVVKRLTPLIEGFTALFNRVNTNRPRLAVADGEVINDPQVTTFDLLASLTGTVHQLPDHDLDFCLDHTLACVAWRQGNAWQPLRSPPLGGVFLLGAADRLDVQLRLFWEVLQESLSDFSLGLLLSFLTTPAANGYDREQQQALTSAPVMARPTMAPGH